MKSLLKVISFFSFISSILFILLALTSLFERSLFGSGLMFADVEIFFILGVVSLFLGFILVYLRNKLNKNITFMIKII
jgi:hypothetical protein